MKRIDKLIITSFFGPFFLTFLVVVFILLTQHMLKYFDDIVGKDLGWDVLAQLLFYFAVFLTPVALPLAVLLSSLMTFGNLGEHFELTAIKSAGISLLRALLPIFVFVLGLTVFAFYSNNYFVPKAALEAYSLLYDIKQKKPALDLKQGAFYNGIPDFSIKVDKKHDDGKTIEQIIMYDHRDIIGNKKVIMADSGLMYTIKNDRYLKLELYRGNFYFEDFSETAKNKPSKETMSRSSFDRSEYVLDLSSFGLDRTDQSLFEGNRIMRNLDQLVEDVDSVQEDIYDLKLKIFNDPMTGFYYHLRQDTLVLPKDLKKHVDKKLLAGLAADTITGDSSSVKSAEAQNALNEKLLTENAIKVDDQKPAFKKSPRNRPSKVNEKSPRDSNRRIRKRNGNKINDTLTHAGIVAYVDSIRALDVPLNKIQTTLNNVRQAKSKIQAHNTRLDWLIKNRNVYEIQYHKILANSVACIIMFLIGAPLGAIIKRGGLGMPVLMSIIFFIIFYVLSMTGEKWAKQDTIEPLWGIWSANIILLPVGLFFLRQARNDVRLFEADFYSVIFDKIRTWLGRKRVKQNATQ